MLSKFFLFLLLHCHKNEEKSRNLAKNEGKSWHIGIKYQKSQILKNFLIPDSREKSAKFLNPGTKNGKYRNPGKAIYPPCLPLVTLRIGIKREVQMCLCGIILPNRLIHHLTHLYKQVHGAGTVIHLIIPQPLFSPRPPPI